MVHVIPFLTIMEVINFIIIFLSGCNLQVSIQKQDEKGRYYVLLFADSGHTRVSLVTTSKVMLDLGILRPIPVAMVIKSSVPSRYVTF